MISRRQLLERAAVLGAGLLGAQPRGERRILQQFDYGQVQLGPGPLQTQCEQTHELLMSLDEDSLLRPMRAREGLRAPGRDMGGWYDAYAFAPACTFGQWVSALSRYYAATGDAATREKVLRLVRAYAATVEPSGKFYVENRFPAYFYDKIVCGLTDADQYARDPLAQAALRRATDAAAPDLPETARERRETPVLHREDFTDHCWDESYTLPENLFLAWRRTGDARYRTFAERFLLDREYFDPLARGENVLPGRHAYSHVNALSSAAAAYLALGDEKYFKAAKNGFEFVEQQSYATGGWGPEEHFVEPGSGKLGESLASTHSSFETPCGSYAHFKITRYLLRITRDSRYGDSMERVMYNTVLGAKPIQSDGRSFYYSDYNFQGRKTYHPDKWPCCSGTLPQIATDYHISAYFRDGDDVYVNLYTPSVARWAGRSLRQQTEYPASGNIRIDLDAPAPATFSIFLRIPEWTRAPRVTVSGVRDSLAPIPGSFAEIRREWKNGDRIELELPQPRRLQPVDAQHPDLIAVLEGPQVLMAVGTLPERIERAELLRGLPGLHLAPFTQIADEPYTAYLRVA
jgi:uncharacterized protein